MAEIFDGINFYIKTSINIFSSKITHHTIVLCRTKVHRFKTHFHQFLTDNRTFDGSGGIAEVKVELIIFNWH